MFKKIIKRINVAKRIRRFLRFFTVETYPYPLINKPKLETTSIDNLTSYEMDIKKEINNPIVRICVITYNNVRFTRGCLNGLLMQKTNFPFEIYIYDDCSTDGTSDIIREYAGKYSNIITEIQTKNLYGTDRKLWDKKVYSIFKDHNRKYVAVADGDDHWIDQYKLQIQVDFLRNHSDFSMCSGGYLINYDFNGNQEIRLALTKHFIGIEYDFISAHSNLINLVKNFTRVYKTEAMPEYEIVRKYSFFRDVHLAYYVLQKGRGYYFQRIFGNCNICANGIFSGLSSNEQRDINYKVYEELYRETRDEQVKKHFIQKV